MRAKNKTSVVLSVFNSSKEACSRRAGTHLLTERLGTHKIISYPSCKDDLKTYSLCLTIFFEFPYTDKEKRIFDLVPWVKSYLVDEDLVDAAALDVESLKKLLLPVVPHLM